MFLKYAVFLISKNDLEKYHQIKMFMTGMIAVLLSGTILQPILALAVMTMYLLCLLHTSPYQSYSHDRMAFLSLTTICINLFMSVLIALEGSVLATNENRTEASADVLDRDSIGWGLIILNCLVGAVQLLVMVFVDCRPSKIVESGNLLVALESSALITPGKTNRHAKTKVRPQRNESRSDELQSLKDWGK